MSYENMHIRHCILFTFQLKKSVEEATEMICKALGEGAVSQSTVKIWFQKFSEGNYDLCNEDRYGRSPRVKDDVLEQLLEQNPHLTQKELAEKLNISQAAISVRLKKLGRITKKSRTAKNMEFEQLLRDNPNMTQKEIADRLGLSQSAVSIRLKKLGRVTRPYRTAKSKSPVPGETGQPTFVGGLWENMYPQNSEDNDENGDSCEEFDETTFFEPECNLKSD